ncbi:hypothetical protein ACSBR2_020637 [Camellia fascicularis]
MEEGGMGMVGKLGRQCYAVLCLGVLLISVAISHYALASDPNSDPPHHHHHHHHRHHHRTKQSLRPSSQSY